MRIPLEINFCLFTIAAFVLSFGTCTLFVKTIEGTLVEMVLISGINPQFDNALIYSINIGTWCIALYSIFAGAMLLKYIFTTGLIKYLKEHLLIIKLLKFQN